MNVLEEVGKVYIEGLTEDQRAIFDLGISLEEENKKAYRQVAAEINKKHCDEMFEKIFGHDDLT